MNFFSRTQKKILDNLRLNSDEVHYILKQLIGDDLAWILYEDASKNPLYVRIIQLDTGAYFAELSCEGLSGLGDRQLFIKNAVEFAIKQNNLAISFKDIGVGGVVGDVGRLSFLAAFVGKTPPANHGYAAFKLPGEEQVCIENPRTGIFDVTEKLQTRTDDQVCCFAASALFYFCYKTLERGDTTRTTPELFAELYKSSKLRGLIQKLEKKVGHTVATKDQIIDSFIKQLLSIENPIKPLEDSDEFLEEPLESSAALTI